MILYRDKQRDISLNSPDELRSLDVPEDVIRDLKDYPDIARGFYFGDGQYVFNDKAADSSYIRAHEESHYLRDTAQCRHRDELHEECLTDLLTARRIGKAETICAIRNLCREIERHYMAPKTIRALKIRMRFVGIFA